MRNLIAVLALTLATTVVQAGVPEAGDEVNAKLARIKSFKSAGSNGKNSADANAAKLLDDGCSIAIGNIFDSGSGGASTSAKRETTVIVTGDVIQAGNKCD